MIEKPHIFSVPRVNSKSGTLSFMEVSGTLPFEVKQLYWIYNIHDDGADRGNHAHLNTDRVIVCISGIIDATLESVDGTQYTFQLNDPSEVLFYPRMHWINLKFHPEAIAAVAASDTFKNDITIKDFAEFKRLTV